MIVEIIQVVGVMDKTPEKNALLSDENILLALKTVFPDEDFVVNIIEK
jgi:hypothetical protein